MSLKLKCHSNLNVSNLSVTKIGMSLKLKYHSNWNVIKLECHTNLNVIQIGRLNRLKKVVNPKTSNSASIGQTLILFY